MIWKHHAPLHYQLHERKPNIRNLYNEVVKLLFEHVIFEGQFSFFPFHFLTTMLLSNYKLRKFSNLGSLIYSSITISFMKPFQVSFSIILFLFLDDCSISSTSQVLL